MEDPLQMYSKFNTFLRGFLIRRVERKFHADDFDDSNSDYIRPHLEKLLPSLSLTEATRVRIYFNDLLVYHLKDKLRKPSHLAQELSPLSPMEVLEDDNAILDPKVSKIQSRSEEISRVYSSQIDEQLHTPLETLEALQRRKTVPLMQSTPLSVPLTIGGQSGTLSNERRQEDDFIADIISQINLSPIPQLSVQQRSKVTDKDMLANQEGVSFINMGQEEISFLRGFADINKITHKGNKRKIRKTCRITRDRLAIGEPLVKKSKKRRRKKNFDALCYLAQTEKSEEQLRKVEASSLHFNLVPGKTRSMINRIINKVIVPEGERGHIPIERIINLSNVLRSHANQRQSSIEQPGQISILSAFRSPCTPQALLRISQLQPFTPVRAEVSGQSPGIEMDPISSFPSHSILSQQPLLPIPERDSSIRIPLSPQIEEIPFNNSISVPQLPENLSTIPLDIGEDLVSSTNFPRPMLENMDITDAEPQTTNGDVPINDVVVPMLQLDDIIHQDNVSPVVANGDNAPFSWFDVLRSRKDIVYPQVTGEKRKRKKRKKEEEERDIEPRRIHQLPEIARSPERSDFPNFPVLPDDFSHQITRISVGYYADEFESEFDEYYGLIKEAGRDPECRMWERFNPYLFSETDDFEMYTYILKRIIKDDFVAMNTLYAEGTSRLEAAKGFRLVLELQTMGLIEIESVDSCIKGFRFKASDDSRKY